MNKDDVIIDSSERGRHAELLAQAAFIANGWSVLEPVSPKAYDMAVRNQETGETIYVQTKMAYLRDEERYNGPYLRVKGVRNNGKLYTREEVDVFAVVWEGEVYIFPNEEKTEYWVKPENIGERWTRLAKELN